MEGTKQVGESTTVSAIDKTPDLQPYDPNTLGDLDCGPATLTWTERSMGGKMNLMEARIIADDGPNGGIMAEGSIRKYCQAKGHTYVKRTPGLTTRQRCAEVFSEIEKGNRAILRVNDPSSSIDHMVGIKSVTKTPMISSKGFDVSRYSFSIMDPSYSNYVNQNWRYVGKAISAFYIRP